MDSTYVLDQVIRGGVTLAAAYVGARFAFGFNSKQQRQLRRTGQIEECNRAMLNLMGQFDELTGYRDQELSKYRDSPFRHFQLSAHAENDIDRLSVNAAALAFLIGSKASNIPVELALLERKYRACQQLVNIRSEVHLTQLQPLLETKLRDYETGQIASDLVEAAVGPRLSNTLKRVTDNIYNLFDSTIVSFTEAGKDLPTQMKTVFPEAKFVAFSPRPITVSS